jgi:hypothetical protein
MAEYVADGRPSIDIASFSPDRFDPRETEEFLASTIAQKDLPRRRH